MIRANHKAQGTETKIEWLGRWSSVWPKLALLGYGSSNLIKELPISEIGGSSMDIQLNSV